MGSHDHHLSLIFGILGNVVSFIVFLAPLPTFRRIIKRKSTEGFQPIPYSVALFSSMVLLYYACVKKHALMILTINSIGCFIESMYLIIYLIYATREAKIYTTKLLFVFNFLAYGGIVLGTYVFSKGHQRVMIVGLICGAFSVCVFAAPLSVIREVIRTQSVEFMPFPLSFSLTICAIMWGLYGLAIRDFFIATPNVLGIAFGIVQMGLYLRYRTRVNSTTQINPTILQETNYPQEVPGNLPQIKLQEKELIEIRVITIDHHQENINSSDSINRHVINGRVGNSTVVPSDELDV